MSRYLPIALGALVIVGLTIPQIRISDRFKESNVKAEEFAELLESVPMEIGDWRGEDLDVDEQVRRTAGAVGYVSRTYSNIRTHEHVTLWLIVGHARDISAHTPEICYPASGFIKRAENNSQHTFLVEDQPPASFFTNTFIKEDYSGRSLKRVFWSWYRPNDEHEIRWEAPEHPRWEFGNARAVYKMYFSSDMREPKETTEQSPCARFAEDFLPIVNAALVAHGGQTDVEPAGAGGAESADTSDAA